MIIPTIEECSKNVRLIYTLLIDIVLTTIAALMMPGVLGGYYNNIVIHSPTIWYNAPDTMLAWCPVLDSIVFTVLFGVLYVVLWFIAFSAKEEEDT
jgi:hypothetical protein